MKTWLKILIALFVLGIIAIILVYVFIYNKPHPDFEKMKPAYSMNAADLYNAFLSDSKGSDARYSGKVIEINGKVDRVESNDSTVVAVFVFNQGIFGDEGIRCFMLKKYN